MDNGIIVVDYGRPGDWIMFSRDESTSWGPVIPFHQGLYPPDCSNYFSLAELAPMAESFRHIDRRVRRALDPHPKRPLFLIITADPVDPNGTAG